MGFELREHTADVAVEATGATLGATFGAAADGMAAAMCDAIPEGGDRHEVTVSAESRDALLFDYLDELIYERDTRSVLPVENTGTVSPVDSTDTVSPVDSTDTVHDREEWTFEGSYRGVDLSRVTARDLKAVTYSEMDISETDDGWRAYVVFDV